MSLQTHVYIFLWLLILYIIKLMFFYCVFVCFEEFELTFGWETCENGSYVARKASENVSILPKTIFQVGQLATDKAYWQIWNNWLLCTSGKCDQYVNSYPLTSSFYWLLICPNSSVQRSCYGLWWLLHTFREFYVKLSSMTQLWK